MIKLKKVNKVYYPNIKALDNVDLIVEKGDVFGIIGLSGAGKSTLIRTINGLEAIDSGQILVNGMDIAQLNEKDLLKVRQKIGIIFQNFNLLTQQTVLNNVLLPLKISKYPKVAALQKAKDLLKMVGLESKLEAYPAQLSGGQQQRVAIARALANDPDILLVDEATSALDPKTTLSILALLKDINQQLGITIVLITHEMNVIEEICQKVAIMDQGEVVEVGLVKSIFQKPQSKMGKQLIYPSTTNYSLKANELRVTFDGHQLSEPVISKMVLEVGEPVNIIFADMKTLDNQMVGQLILECPSDPRIVDRMCSILEEQKITYEKGEASHV